MRGKIIDICSWRLWRRTNRKNSNFMWQHTTIAIAKNIVFHPKTRHINMKFHFIQEAIHAKEIELVYWRTEEQNCWYSHQSFAKWLISFLKRNAWSEICKEFRRESWCLNNLADFLELKKSVLFLNFPMSHSSIQV